MFNFIMLIIVIAGALNWFSIGMFQFDLIAGIFGTQAHFGSRFLYTIIGIAGIWLLIYATVKKGKLILLQPKDKSKNKQDKQSPDKELNDAQGATSNSATPLEAQTPLMQGAISSTTPQANNIDTIILTNRSAVDSTPATTQTITPTPTTAPPAKQKASKKSSKDNTG